MGTALCGRGVCVCSGMLEGRTCGASARAIWSVRGGGSLPANPCARCGVWGLHPACSSRTKVRGAEDRRKKDLPVIDHGSSIWLCKPPIGSDRKAVPKWRAQPTLGRPPNGGGRGGGKGRVIAARVTCNAGTNPCCAPRDLSKRTPEDSPHHRRRPSTGRLIDRRAAGGLRLLGTRRCSRRRWCGCGCCW